MSTKQIVILIVAFAVSALILWHELPIEFPWIIYKVVMLFFKLFAVLALTAVVYVFAGGKKSSSAK